MSDDWPADLEAEAAVLGGVLLRPDALARVVAEGVGPDDFHDARHGAVYCAMLDLATAGLPVDPVLLQDQLRRNGTEAMSGALGYLGDLLARVPTAENIGHYARIVRHAALRRRVMESAAELIDAARDGYEEFAGLAARAARIGQMLAEAPAAPTAPAVLAAGRPRCRVCRQFAHEGSCQPVAAGRSAVRRGA